MQIKFLQKCHLTFLFGAGGGKVLVLCFDERSVTFHSAEERASGTRAQPGRAWRDVGFNWQSS